MIVLIAGGGTGGHLMPALAIAHEIARVRPDLEPVLIGARRGIESTLLPRYAFRHYLLAAEPLYRRQWWRNVRWPAIAWRLWRDVGRVLERERPALVIGTGGYASGPVVWRAQRRGVPTVLQEQNAFPGLATRWLAPDARQIHLGFPEAEARLRPGAETRVYALGNPIRAPAPGDRAGALAELGLPADRPALLVFGGSQGARTLNEAVAGALAQGSLAGVSVIWGTGDAHAARYAPLARAGHVIVRGFLDPMATAYRAANVIVCRGGAMTVAEVCAWGKACIVVPLPTAAADHQTVNARALAAAGAAVHLAERDLTATSLAQTVLELLGDRARLASLEAAAATRGRPRATQDTVSTILTLVPEPQSLSQV
jgi:UDP-N-acetylglucosamine--N-acetylmuramyl-(pentapeptide) pyrophosphoryl-undecaprenol N-acetylglucosamine transferase